MSLRTELRDCRAQLAKAQTDLAACRTDSTAKDAVVADLTAANTEKDLKIAALTKQVATLEARVKELEAQSPPPAPDDFEKVPSGANLQQVVKAAGPGAKLQLPAKLDVTQGITPMSGQWLRGPCELVGKGVVQVINCKVPNAVGVTLEALDVSGAEMTGVVFWKNTKLIDSRLHHNAVTGAGAGNADAGMNALVQRCEIDHNGSAAEVGHGAGGIKVYNFDGLVVDDSDIHDNFGNGVWGDSDCGDITVQNSRIFKNGRKGCFYEKCGEGYVNFNPNNAKLWTGMFTVTGNAIHDNNQETDANGKRSTSHAGVTMAASKHGRISNNTYGGNIRAVYVYNDPIRVADDQPGFIMSDVEIVYTQAELAGDVVVGCDAVGVKCNP